MPSTNFSSLSATYSFSPRPVLFVFGQQRCSFSDSRTVGQVPKSAYYQPLRQIGTDFVIRKDSTKERYPMKKYALILLAYGLTLLGGSDSAAKAQDIADSEAVRLPLTEAIRMAREHSVDAAVALQELRAAYWQWRTYRAELLPGVNLTATLPDYRRAYSLYQQPDGSYNFVRTNVLRTAGQVSIDQNIWLTGGKLSLVSSLEHINPLGTQGADKHFMSVPISLTLSQPLFGLNETKWSRRIEPVRYEEARRRFVAGTEEVSVNCIEHYFSALLAREQLNNAETNLRNTAKLVEVARAKKKIGKLSENELRAVEISHASASSAILTSRTALHGAEMALCIFLGLQPDARLALSLPSDTTFVPVSYEQVMELARRNHPFVGEMKRRMLEADRSLARAKAERFSVELMAQIGYAGRADNLPDAYGSRLQDNSSVSVGVRIPIVDWGRGRGRIRMAESNRRLEEHRLRQEEEQWHRQIFLLVEHYNNQLQALALAQRTDSLAQARYQTAVETFTVGAISALDLTTAQDAKDAARTSLVKALHHYWSYYYNLRSLTAYDLVRNEEIAINMEEI